ncbi:anhydro-N-acetylmuramic acid kinase [Maritimibacter sp. 55A14]|uniref:anhydro-N-acetylmuramic acid kinase n=1 Tax=Maritimibacter sp. 55A14 TaxID=2174844 RepID=UPI000D60E7DA|nr:anhydro-N-acetylmuramic acid kinase [Maritimibacter sp. 55A14]PWE34447.1 anhydro-N-acetylmuramic acid kinase [Maritimibacter sp. 55A14]
MRKHGRERAPLWALGAMSGTSMDGVDMALLRTDGVEILEFGETGYRPYTDAERATLAAAQGRWPGEPGVAAAEAVVRAAHAELLAGAQGVDLLGFHGQTLAHEPRGRGTHQAGDGARLAEQSGLTVVWDFRSSDVALGGEGAPLAPFYHWACARRIGAGGPVAFLNLGGVGNLTWVDPRAAAPEAEGALLAFDTGPANAPIDDLLRARGGPACDEGGALAAAGRADAAVVARMLEQPHFFRIPPKSLDRNEFSFLLDAMSELTTEDACATLAACIAAAVARGTEHFPAPVERFLVAGGGRRNAHIMNVLQAELDVLVQPVEDVGLDGDMLEAQAFAYLGVRVLYGLPTSCPGTTGVAAAVGGGQISRPGE